MKAIKFLKVYVSLFLIVFLVIHLVVLFFVGLDDFKEVVFSDMLKTFLTIAGFTLAPTILTYKKLNQKEQ